MCLSDFFAYIDHCFPLQNYKKNTFCLVDVRDALMKDVVVAMACEMLHPIPRVTF